MRRCRLICSGVACEKGQTIELLCDETTRSLQCIEIEWDLIVMRKCPMRQCHGVSLQWDYTRYGKKLCPDNMRRLEFSMHRDKINVYWEIAQWEDAIGISLQWDSIPFVIRTKVWKVYMDKMCLICKHLVFLYILDLISCTCLSVKFFKLFEIFFFFMKFFLRFFLFIFL